MARPLFYMTLSTGIGGGIVQESCFAGADSYAGEIGHLPSVPMARMSLRPQDASSGCVADYGSNAITANPQEIYCRTQDLYRNM